MLTEQRAWCLTSRLEDGRRDSAGKKKGQHALALSFRLRSIYWGCELSFFILSLSPLSIFTELTWIWLVLASALPFSST